MSISKVGPDGLNDRQRLFCEYYVVNLNPSEAAILAGYAKTSAYTTSSDLLKYAHIQKKILELKQHIVDAVASKAEDVLAEIKMLAHSDIADFVELGEDGILKTKAFSSLKPGLTRCIQKIKQRRTMRHLHDGSGDQLVESILEFALWDKPKCLDLEGQYHTIWNQKGSSLSQDTASELLRNVASALEGRIKNEQSTA